MNIFGVCQTFLEEKEQNGKWSSFEITNNHLKNRNIFSKVGITFQNANIFRNYEQIIQNAIIFRKFLKFGWICDQILKTWTIIEYVNKFGKGRIFFEITKH